jgi:hypothetical protein
VKEILIANHYVVQVAGNLWILNLHLTIVVLIGSKETNDKVEQKKKTERKSEKGAEGQLSISIHWFPPRVLGQPLKLSTE